MAREAVAAEHWHLRGGLAAPLRRGALVAVPVLVLLLLYLVADDALAGGAGSAALFAGFVAFDAPARVRARWQLATAPVLGAAACVGVLSSQSGLTAVVAMALVATAGGFCVAVSARLAIAGLTVILAFLIAQGLLLDTDEALPALALGIAGALSQSAWAWICGLVDRGRETARLRIAAAREALRANLTLASPSLRHALRFGIALAIGVAIYRIVDLGPHGYWVPLTILFVLKPDFDETTRRLAMRAAGTVVGLVLATASAELLGDRPLVAAVILSVAAAFAYALLTLQYALFTT
ncbi:MAG: FUSC family protein, partial [Actinomycetota bacterium]|nr:FUSC family protein [Actinomycetota bacterium]